LIRIKHSKDAHKALPLRFTPVKVTAVFIKEKYFWMLKTLDVLDVYTGERTKKIRRRKKEIIC